MKIKQSYILHKFKIIVLTTLNRGDVEFLCDFKLTDWLYETHDI